MANQPLYDCKYCKKKFFNERTFMKHECTQMVRSREIQTIIGQSAYGMYKHWLEKQRRKPPPVEGFLTSSYYTSFIKFAEWCKETSIPDPQKYIELMVSEKISPALWRRNDAYQIYLEYVDKRSDPYEQVGVSVDTLLSISELMEVPPGEIFKSYTAGDILMLIQQRKLSPWLLFCSKKFKEWIGSLHEVDRSELMRSIGIEYWATKLEKAPEVVKQVKVIAEEMGI